MSHETELAQVEGRRPDDVPSDGLVREESTPSPIRPRVGARRASERASGPGLTAVIIAAAVLLVAVVLRFDGLAAHLPALLAVDVDEPTVVTRAVGIMHGTLPTVYDWPTGSMLFVVVPFELVRHLDPTWFQRNTYLVARYVFAGVSVVVVILTGGLAWLMASGRSERRADTLLASTAVAVSFLLVENGRLVLPDQLQLALVLAAMIGILIYDRTRARSWLVAVGVLAGLAAGTKYLGGLVMVPAAMSVLLEWRRGWTRAATDVGMLLGGALVGLVASVPAVILHPHDVIAGIQFQFGHQAGGHLGYDLGSNGWWYYLTQGLPGNWGWVMTALSLAGLILVAARGTRGQRLVLVFVVLVFAVLGSSKIQFPHYIVLIVPMMAAFAAIFVTWASGHLQRWGGPLLTLALPVVLVVGLVPTVADDLRVVRSASAPNTELVADRVVGNLPGPVWAEPYTVAVATHNQINHAIIGQTPSVVDCRCYVVVSSFMEDRYRQEPLKYAREIAVYDAVERKGELVATIAPRRALPYDWMELPRYGVGSLPLTGATGRVGPRITIYKMPS